RSFAISTILACLTQFVAASLALLRSACTRWDQHSAERIGATAIDPDLHQRASGAVAVEVHGAILRGAPEALARIEFGGALDQHLHLAAELRGHDLAADLALQLLQPLEALDLHLVRHGAPRLLVDSSRRLGPRRKDERELVLEADAPGERQRALEVLL